MRHKMRCGGPRNGSSPQRGGHDFAMWDAAYVLGSLCSAERREFEAHLASALRAGRLLRNSAICPDPELPR